MSAKGSYSESPWESPKIIFVKSDGDCRGYVSSHNNDDLTQNDSGQIIATKPPFLVTPNGSILICPELYPWYLFMKKMSIETATWKEMQVLQDCLFKKLQLPLENRIATTFPDHACGC